MDVLTGNEKWLKIDDVIYCKGFPVVHVELSCGLLTIDVMGLTQVIDMHDEPITVGYEGKVIEDLYLI